MHDIQKKSHTNSRNNKSMFAVLEEEDIGMREKNKMLQNKYIVLLLITGAVYFFLRFISPLLTPVIIAGMFLTFCYPAFDDIQKKTKIKKQYLAGVILFLICGVLIILVWMGGSLLLQNIPIWVEGLDDVQRNMRLFVTDCCNGVGGFLGINTEGLAQVLIEQIDVFVENFQVQVLPGILGGTWSYIRQLLSIIGVLAVTMIATMLLAKDYDSILAFMGAHEGSRTVLEIVLRVLRYVATFVKAQVIIMISIAVVCSLSLFFAGVENGVWFGILAGVLDALPFIGTGIVLVPLAIWQLFSGFYWKAAVCVIIYIVCALLREFLEPKLIGQKVGVYPVAILIAVYAGLKLFGLWGIVKGPIGLVLIMQIYAAYERLLTAENK